MITIWLGGCVDEIILKVMKKNEELSNKLERYYQYLKFDNELDAIIKGVYVTDGEIENILKGMY